MPWGDEAFAIAERENKPVFLSIGYAACHWCHVMEHESFENVEIAEILNHHFICVKVDREERPDIDHHYMQAVQRMTGQGGWPLSVFLKPDRKPFYGGTYWPAVAKHGRPGFGDLLTSLINAWEQQRTDIDTVANEIHNLLKEDAFPTGQNDIKKSVLDIAIKSAMERFDSAHGGFGRAPKFPQPMQLGFLLRQGARTAHRTALEMTILTLEKMARGGIFDHLGGGFHRYSTDDEWLIPHFEKMLYDNVLLIPIYLDAWLTTGRTEFKATAHLTLEWVLREMRVDEGGFASSLDADSEGQEGKFYVWAKDDIRNALPTDQAEFALSVFNISSEGQFENDESVLHIDDSATINAERLGLSVEQYRTKYDDIRNCLLTWREQRQRPARDDKVLTDWNGLTISAFVRAFAVLGEPRYLEVAQQTADRLLRPFEKTGKLVHSFLGQRTNETQLLLDYSALGNGLLDLFMADGDQRWFAGCINLAKTADKQFSQGNTLYSLSDVGVANIVSIDPYDSALPSGIALAGNLMARLYHITADNWFEERAKAQILPLMEQMEMAPLAFSQSMLTVDMLLNPPAQLVLVGDTQRTLWKIAHGKYQPCISVFWMNDSESYPTEQLKLLLAGKIMQHNRPTAYLCRNFVCEAPITSESELNAALHNALEYSINRDRYQQFD